MVPTVGDLMQKYGIDAAVAFDIGRPKLRLAMRVRLARIFPRLRLADFLSPCAQSHDESGNKKDLNAQEQKRKAGLLAKLAKERAAGLASNSTSSSVSEEVKALVDEVKTDDEVKTEDVKMDEIKSEDVVRSNQDPSTPSSTGDVVMSEAVVDTPASPAPVAAARTPTSASSSLRLRLPRRRELN
jgi:THO complex subunit 2